MTEQTREQFTELDDEQATEIAGRMFNRAFNDIERLGCPLNCCFGGILRACITQALERVADPRPLAAWMRDVADELESEVEARGGRVQ